MEYIVKNVSFGKIKLEEKINYSIQYNYTIHSRYSIYGSKFVKKTILLSLYIHAYIYTNV